MEDGRSDSTPLAGMIVLGLAAGTASALLGIGAGALVVPTLSGLMGVPLRRAVGISLGAMVGIVAVGLTTEAIVAQDNIRWELGLTLVIGAQVGVRIGGMIMKFLPDRALRYLLFTLLIIVAARMIGFLGTGDIEGLFPDGNMISELGLSILGVGVAAGIMSVMFGLGGGVLVVPALLFLVEGMFFQSARATSLMMILPTAIAGATLHIKEKNAAWNDIWPVMIPGCFGAVGGVLLANFLEAPQLHKLFAVFVIFAAARLLGKRTPAPQTRREVWLTGGGDGI